MNKVYPYNWLNLSTPLGFCLLIFILVDSVKDAEVTSLIFMTIIPAFAIKGELTSMLRFEVEDDSFTIKRLIGKNKTYQYSDVRSYLLQYGFFRINTVTSVILTMHQGSQITIKPSGTKNFPELLEWIEANFKNWQTVEAESPYS